MRTRRYAVRAAALLLTVICLFLVPPFTAGAETRAAMRGDVNGDGTVSAGDYLLLKRYVLGTYSFAADQETAGDVNRDGRINSLDYLLVKRHALGAYRIDPGDPAREQLLRRVNEVRRKHGADELVYRWDIQAAADTRAREIVNEWSHRRPDGSPFFTAIYEEGVYGYCAEVLTYGDFGAGTAVDLWMRSTAGHRQILLGEEWSGMAAGHFAEGDVQYWVALFVKNPREV